MASTLAEKLLHFLNQSDDLETDKILKMLDLKSSIPFEKKPPVIKAPPQVLGKAPALAPPPKIDLKVEAPLPSIPAPVKTFSIYDKLSTKVQKACPELSIKKTSEVSLAPIPDCDVLLLSQKVLPDVYAALLKAIDNKLAFAEALFMDNALIPALLDHPYKLILAPPFLQKWPSFMQHVRQGTRKKQAYFGSSPILFLEEAEALSQDPNLKGALWQMLKLNLS